MIRACPLHGVLRVGVNLPKSLLIGGIQTLFPPMRRDIGRLLGNPFFATFGYAWEAKKGSAAFAPPNIGGVSEGRGGFGALRIPHAKPCSLNFLIPF